MDYLKWKQDIGNIEVWLDEMENMDNDDVGKSLDEVNLLLHLHLELETSLQLENDRVENIIRVTKIEMQMQEIKAQEEMSRKQERDRIMRESDELLKRKEQVRTTRNEKRDEERRRTQEITFPNEG